MTNFKERLKEYLEIDQIYQDYKKGKEPAHNDGCSDFEWFCIEHCKDIENLLEEAEELQEESYKLSELWCKSAEENKELHNKIDKAINYIKEQGCYDEDCNVFCTDLNYYAIPRLLEILEKDSDVDE